MSQLLSAAQACEATLLNFYSSPIEYDENLKRYLLGFKISGKQTLAFRGFLNDNFNTYVPIGLYPEPL